MARARSAAALAEAAPVFAALGDATRLRLVARLCTSGPASITQLTGAADVSRQAVTKHLLALQDAGLVRSDRSGRERIWVLQTRRLAQVRQYLEQISAQWDGTLDRLRDFVESDPAS